MNRYRNWAGALHWGQLLLLIPTLLFAGVAVGGGAYLFTIDSSASYAVGKAETALREDSARVQENREYEASSTPTAQERELLKRDGFSDDQIDAMHLSYEAVNRRPLDTNLVRAVENAQAAKELMDSRGAWVLGVGIFGWAFSWLTAFLTLWWWFGARAKPKGAQ
jgi:hypothetical protein